MTAPGDYTKALCVLQHVRSAHIVGKFHKYLVNCTCPDLVKILKRRFWNLRTDLFVEDF